MSIAGVRTSLGSRLVGVAFAGVAAATVWVSAADARVRYRPPFSYIVVDARSGATLAAEKADGRRYPASLTKMMTLYLLFEKLQSGTLTLQSQLKVSRHAASQSPSTLGLQPGDTIRVDQAIKAIVTRSANDVAVVIGEALADSEAAFAQRMTDAAHQLGMNHTVYRNASGLPNPGQYTTARDQAILGQALSRRFPHYFKYFSTDAFRFHGHEIANHNHLLGKVPGVDGIKTGFTRASGYNLVTSVHRGGRRLVAVVLGGRTVHQRDAVMRYLIERHIAKAVIGRDEPSSAAATRLELVSNAVALPRRRPPAGADQVESADAATAKPATGTASADAAEAKPANDAGTASANAKRGGEGAADAMAAAANRPIAQAATATAAPKIATTVETSREHAASAGRSLFTIPTAQAEPIAAARAGVPNATADSRAIPIWLSVLLAAVVVSLGFFMARRYQMLYRLRPIASVRRRRIRRYRVTSRWWIEIG